MKIIAEIGNTGYLVQVTSDELFSLEGKTRPYGFDGFDIGDEFKVSDVYRKYRHLTEGGSAEVVKIVDDLKRLAEAITPIEMRVSNVIEEMNKPKPVVRKLDLGDNIPMEPKDDVEELVETGVFSPSPVTYSIRLESGTVFDRMEAAVFIAGHFQDITLPQAEVIVDDVITGNCNIVKAYFDNHIANEVLNRLKLNTLRLEFYIGNR